LFYNNTTIIQLLSTATDCYWHTHIHTPGFHLSWRHEGRILAACWRCNLQTLCCTRSLFCSLSCGNGRIRWKHRATRTRTRPPLWCLSISHKATLLTTSLTTKAYCSICIWRL